MAAVELAVSDDHPLALELVSLRTAVDRYQHEAHAASVKLQRHSLDTTHAIERAYALESENVKLREELATLRAHPDSTPHPASLQVHELTIAHRRLSDKLTSTEEILLARATELAHARSDLNKAQHLIDSAHELAAQRQGNLQIAHTRQRDLERKLRAAEEERKLSDLVVQEYADLVRTLEGRPRTQTASALSSPFSLGNVGNNSSTTLVDSLSEGRSGLQKLLGEFNEENEQLGADISCLQGQLATLSVQLDAEKRRGEGDRVRLAHSLVELEKYRNDDNTAAKMVSRYMRFSQSSTDSLQKAMDNMKARYTASADTFDVQINHLQKALETERRQSEKLRQALDELTEDISREAFGRRREISLRLAFLGREESLAEGLRRWVKRSRESFDRLATTREIIDPAVRDVFGGALREAEALLETLNGQPSVEDNGFGLIARVVAAQDIATQLTHELQVETDRRMQLERLLVKRQPVQESSPQEEVAELVSVPNHNKPAASVELDRPLPARGASLWASLIVAPQQTAEDSPREESTSRTEVTTTICTAPQIVVSEGETTPITDGESSITCSVPDSEVPEASLLHNDTIPSATTPETASLDPPPVPSAPDFSVSIANDTRGEADAASASAAEIRTGDVVPSQDMLLQPISAPARTTSAIDVSSSISVSLSNGSARVTGVPPPIPLTGLVFPSAGDITPPAANLFSPTAPPPPKPETTGMAQDAQDAPDTTAFATNTLILSELFKVRDRYEVLQRGFRDCHLALTELKKSLSLTDTSSEMALILQKAVERLDDVNEDARVELEIRVSDEARITSGYEALLTIPGAMSDEVDEVALKAEMQAFADGTDKAVTKAMDVFNRKLDDLQHDIASVKRTSHELSASGIDSPVEASPPVTVSPSWTSWTANLLSPSRSASPALAPTFGSVMTSPRLRQTSFSSHPRKASDDAPSPSHDPFASLGLRIAMPAHVLPAYPSTPPRTATRPRVSSATYILGLGARSSFGLSSIPATRSPPSPLAEQSLKGVGTTADIYGEEDKDSGSDVE